MAGEMSVGADMIKTDSVGWMSTLPDHPPANVHTADLVEEGGGGEVQEVSTGSKITGAAGCRSGQQGGAGRADSSLYPAFVRQQKL